jgi:hypothetical protein
MWREREREAMQQPLSKVYTCVYFACVQLISRPVRPRVLFKRCYLHLAFGNHSASPAAVSFKLTTHTAPPVKANYTQQQTLKKRRLRRHSQQKKAKRRARWHTRLKQRRSQKEHSHFLLSLPHVVLLATCESCNCPCLVASAPETVFMS